MPRNEEDYDIYFSLLYEISHKEIQRGNIYDTRQYTIILCHYMHSTCALGRNKIASHARAWVDVKGSVTLHIVPWRNNIYCVE